MTTAQTDLLWVGLMTALWCTLHSLFVTHAWDRLVQRRWPRVQALARLAFTVGSIISLLALMVWIRALPQELLWNWPDHWSILRWAGLLTAFLLFWLGARSFDNNAFLGLSQWRAWKSGRPLREPAFSTSGILEMMRHPWYSGTLLFLLFCLPYTDVNLVWRAVFFAYTLVGTELEERKLLKDLGDEYAEYRRRVPRYFPRLLSRKPRP